METTELTEWSLREKAKRECLEMLKGRLRHWENEMKFWMDEHCEHGDEDSINHLRHAESEGSKTYDLIRKIKNPYTLVRPNARMMVK